MNRFSRFARFYSSTTHELIVSQHHNGSRLDRFLNAATEKPISLVQKMIRKKFVRLERRGTVRLLTLTCESDRFSWRAWRQGEIERSDRSCASWHAAAAARLAGPCCTSWKVTLSLVAIDWWRVSTEPSAKFWRTISIKPTKCCCIETKTFWWLTSRQAWPAKGQLVDRDASFLKNISSGDKVKFSITDLLPALAFGSDQMPKLIHRLDKDTSGRTEWSENMFKEFAQAQWCWRAIYPPPELSTSCGLRARPMRTRFRRPTWRWCTAHRPKRAAW